MQKSFSAMKNLRLPWEVLKPAPPTPPQDLEVVDFGRGRIFISNQHFESGRGWRLENSTDKRTHQWLNPHRDRGALSLIIVEGPVASLEGVIGDLVEVGMESQLVAETISLFGALKSRG